MNDLYTASIGLSVSRAASLEDLAACLRQLHTLADKPSCRKLEKDTNHVEGQLPGTSLKRTPLRRNTINQMLLGRIFPGKAFMLTFVETCGLSLEDHSEWMEAWDRIALLRDQEAIRLDEYEDTEPDTTDAPPADPEYTEPAHSPTKEISAANNSPSSPQHRAEGDGARHITTGQTYTPDTGPSTNDPSALASAVAVMAVSDPDRAERLARSISSERWRAAALANIAGTLAISDPDRAERIALSITEKGYKVFARAIVAWVTAVSDPDKAEHVTHSIVNNTHRSFVLANIAGTIAIWDPSRAEQLAESITDQWLRSVVLVTVVTSLTIADPDRAEQIARSIPDIALRASALANVARAMTAMNPSRAQLLIADAENISKSIADERWREWAVARIDDVRHLCRKVRPAENPVSQAPRL